MDDKECIGGLPDVSVIVPTYNRAHLLERTIPSYLQTPVKEVLVVDDGSTDDTETVVKSLCYKYPEIRYFRLEQNSGQCVAKNLGIRMARSNYLYFGDDDSFILEKSIENLIHSMKINHADIAGARAIYLQDGETLEDSLTRGVSDVPLYDINRLRFNFHIDPRVDVKVPFTPACCIISTELARSVMFDSWFDGNGYREETDFLLRCAKEGAEIVFCASAVQVNLPRKESKGGSWSANWLVYEYYTVRNTRRFLQRHYEFLKDHWGLRKSRTKLMFEFIVFDRIPGVIKNLLKGLLGEQRTRTLKRRVEFWKRREITDNGRLE